MEDNSEIRDSVKRCANALKVAKTDSEKLATLLVVAQLEKNFQLTAGERKAVYRSLELAFIERLLNAKVEPEGCEKGTLMSLGVTILSCMINEIDKVSKGRKILGLVPRLVAIIYEANGSNDREEHPSQNSDKEIIDNCFDILLIIASSEDGCKRIMHCWSTKSKDVLNKEKCMKLLQLMANCIAKLKEDALVSFREHVKELFSQAASFFCLSNDQNKFTLLAQILDIFSVCTEKNIFNSISDTFETELKLLRRGLLDVMQSKVDKKYRHMALKLISELIEVFGLKWTCVSFPDEDEKYSKKFLHLLVSLASVEIKMLFYDKSDDITFLSYLFRIMESSIEAISTDKDDIIDTQLGENMATKILQAISGTVKEVVFFLDEIKETLQPTDACKNLKIMACVRLLCAYMSEETQALEKEVVKIAPYMIELGKVSFHLHKNELLTFMDSKDDKSRPVVIFMFLLPVLCHWSADDKTRTMILEAELHSTLWEFLCMLFACQDEDAFESTETVTGIFMNIAITEPKLVSDPRGIFRDMLKLIMQKMYSYLAGPTQLLMNMVTLGLILVRAQPNLQSENADSLITFLRQCLQCFYDTCPFLHVKGKCKVTHWPQISELWFVGLDNLMAYVVESRQLKEILNKDPVALQMRQFIEGNGTDKSKDAESIYAIVKHLLMVLNNGP